MSPASRPTTWARVADCGDCPVNPHRPHGCAGKDRRRSIGRMRAGRRDAALGRRRPSDLPCRSCAASCDGGPVGLIHFDAHSDTNDSYFGDNPYTHGTPFRRAIEEGLLDRQAHRPDRHSRLDLRPDRTTTSPRRRHPHDLHRGVRAARRRRRDGRGEIRQLVGERPVLCVLRHRRPSIRRMAPGTGTPEIGGIMHARGAAAWSARFAASTLIGARSCRGRRRPSIVGGITALTGATMMFELLCIIAEQVGA